MPTIGSGTWTFNIDDGSHVVQATMKSGMWIRIQITVDGETVIEEKAGIVGYLWRDHVFRIGKHACIVKAGPKKRRWQGYTVFDLIIDGVALEEGEHVDFSSSTPGSQQTPMATAQAPSEQRLVAGDPIPMIPVLPPNCSSCGAPINMSNIEWTGPLTASCNTCRSAVEVEWKKLG
jgi:hypothetical protein